MTIYPYKNRTIKYSCYSDPQQISIYWGTRFLTGTSTSEMKDRDLRHVAELIVDADVEWAAPPNKLPPTPFSYVMADYSLVLRNYYADQPILDLETHLAECELQLCELSKVTINDVEAFIARSSLLDCLEVLRLAGGSHFAMTSDARTKHRTIIAEACCLAVRRLDNSIKELLL